MGFLANGIAVWLFFVLGLIGLVSVLALLVNREWIACGIAVTVSIILFFGWIFAATHRIIPVNQQALLLDGSTGKVHGQLYQSGLRKKPLFGRFYLFPASTNHEICQNYTSSIKGGQGVNLTVCFYVDASQLDWLAQFNQYGMLEVGQIQNAWRNQLSSLVVSSVNDFRPNELTEKRDVVGKRLGDVVEPWFSDEGIVLNSITLQNWDFSSPEVAAAYDKTITAQALEAEERAKFDAAKTKRERELYEAETNGLIAEKQASAIKSLGISSGDVVQYLWVKTISESGQMPQTIILSVGDGKPNVSVPQPPVPSVQVESND